MDGRTGWVEEAPLTKVHVLCFDLIISMVEDDVKKGWNKCKIMELQLKK